MLEAFDEEMAIFVLDERANFRPAGISRFAKSKGGHLNNHTSSGRMATIRTIEASLAEACAIEQGMVLQKYDRFYHPDALSETQRRHDLEAQT
jgi:hypothetical protein